MEGVCNRQNYTPMGLYFWGGYNFGEVIIQEIRYMTFIRETFDPPPLSMFFQFAKRYDVFH